MLANVNRPHRYALLSVRVKDDARQSVAIDWYENVRRDHLANGSLENRSFRHFQRFWIIFVDCIDRWRRRLFLHNLPTLVVCGLRSITRLMCITKERDPNNRR